MKRLQQQKGFTLVELAIVLTIIGLLIGGILKGQQLIANAKVTAQMAQVQGIDAAVTTFRDAYAGLPGDLAAPSTRLPSCLAAPCSNVGNGDQKVGPAAQTVTSAVLVNGTAPAFGVATEQDAFWAQLGVANLISGVTPTGTDTFGSLYPNGKLGGGLQAATATDGYLYLTNVAVMGAVTLAAGTGTMSPAQAAQLDRKMDDGIENTGSVLGNGTVCAAVVAGVMTYTETSPTKDCGQYYRIQQ